MKRYVQALVLAAMGSVAVAQEHLLEQQYGWSDSAAPIERRTGSPLLLLGQNLFFDVRLSGTGTTACATCHEPDYAFAEPKSVSQSDGGRLGRRNAPSLINSGLFPELMWDGRFRTLEQQAFSPFQRGEMGIDIAEAERRLNFDAEYVHLFRAALGSGPSAQGMAIALAAYQRTLISGESRFDRFMWHNQTADFTAIELDGFLLFNKKARCSTCHLAKPPADYRAFGLRLFTDFGFHNLGIGFAAGRFADAGRYRVTGAETDVGAFRTPSLRNVAVTAPYMHDGSLATLEEVVDFYDAGGNPNPYLSPLIRPLLLDDYEKTALVAFLRTLTDRRFEPSAITTPGGAYRGTRFLADPLSNPPPLPPSE